LNPFLLLNFLEKSLIKICSSFILKLESFFKSLRRMPLDARVLYIHAQVASGEVIVEHTTRKRLTGVTWRAVIIGLLLIPPVCFWIMEVECVWHTGHPTSMSLMWGVVFVMFVIILLNLLIKRLLPDSALTQGELITIYVMLCMSAGIAGHDTLQLTIPAIPHVFWFATPENEWVDTVQPYVPRWLVVSDKSILRGFYEGKTPFYSKEILGAWLGPTLWWTAFIMALGMIMICLNVIVRKQWTEHEKLAYPIIQLPLAITEGGGSSRFFRDKILWVGFGVAAGIDIINGLHVFYPVIPRIPLRHNYYDIGQYFTEKPLNAIGWVPLPLYPFVIGLGFLLPLDLSFSMWFFYIFRKFHYFLCYYSTAIRFATSAFSHQ